MASLNLFSCPHAGAWEQENPSLKNGCAGVAGWEQLVVMTDCKFTTEEELSLWDEAQAYLALLESIATLPKRRRKE